MGATDRAFKRLLDIFGSLDSARSLLAGWISSITILIKLTSKGPVLYSQKRMGADGRIFTFYKFRTMPIDAEAKTGAVWATPSDDRATPIGKWMRRTSLDEIPQFFNVLRGDMSLVGPQARAARFREPVQT